jgi:outer membrane protein
MEWEAYLGFGFYEAPDALDHSSLEAKPYWRLSQGWGTSSSLANIIRGDIKTENVDVDMTSLFYGHPLSDTLFGLPVEVYLTPGIVHHYSSDVQNAATEYVLAVKFYYTLPLPWRVRVGAAEGISYTDSVTYYEAESMKNKGYRSSKLLNYLDFTLDMNLGDVFRSKTIENLWLGYGIHHRSGIFESSSAFGRISGGSNFNTVYLQWSCKY